MRMPFCERTQLFEFFDATRDGTAAARQLAQRTDAVGVQTDVAHARRVPQLSARRPGARAVADPGDRCAAEIERRTVTAGDDLDDVRIEKRRDVSIGVASVAMAARGS